MTINVRYFDGKISKAHQAYIRPEGDGGGFVLHCAGIECYYEAHEYEFLPSVGNSPAVLSLSDGGRIELPSVVPDWLNLQHKGWFDKISVMEGSFRWVLVSVVLVGLLMFGVLKYGIPTASHHIAQSLPADSLTQVGDKAEEYVMELTEPSTLPQARQEQIIALYDKLNAHPKAKVLVRGGGDLGANAFAIPNNTIVITDELIKLSGDDNEILAVLAHEQGHLVHRHSLEQAISGLGVSVLVVVVTGDASDLLLTLPTMLANAQYSQKAELEADKFAIDALKRLGISPKYLASFFEKIQKEHGDAGNWVMLSTHPNTQERIAQVHQHTH